MDKVPPEIARMICHVLRTEDLSRLSRCNQFFNDISKNVMYSNINIIIGPTGLKNSAKRLLNLLVHNTQKRCAIRSLRIRESVSYTWNRDETGLLRILISIILKGSSVLEFSWIVTEDIPHHALHSYSPPCQHQSLTQFSIPSILTSLTFIGSVNDWDVHFPNIRNLQCGRVQSAQQLSWINWHIRNCKLTKLKVAMRPIARYIYTNIKVELLLMLKIIAGSYSLKTLVLEAVSVELLDTRQLVLLEHLGLRRCEGISSLLSKTVLGRPIMLKTLDLVVTEQSTSCIAQFVVWLAQFTKLEELSLILLGSHDAFPLDPVLLHAQALRRLVLDSRTRIQDPTTIIRYTIADLKKITENCPLLLALGISVLLEASGSYGPPRGPRRFEALVRSCLYRLMLPVN
ncbi:uncharacterized protein RAG0_02980 [Rhynchosporium agropyri]|uniref:F-box domain-containing protein n=1 Tax=Rhynchosporium agropyri TaxID=914238 RepID=A0A1E1K774_9HELO|nr:uncharacterized protein RAG0_02980 [Rhynchosporium agropyri]